MHFKRFRVSRRINLFISLLLAIMLFLPAIASAEPSFTNDLFKAKWQRADKPVNDGTANPARSWLWGPDSFSPIVGNTEPYADSPGGTRQVLYFDKARMEINNPANSLVTNGLLVRELISGKLATGDTAYTQRRAADDIPVAGDPANNNGPTYASFAKITSLNNDNPSTDKTGQPVADTLDKNGNVGSNAELGKKAKYTYFDGTLKHNIPDVFLTFMNQSGNVYVNGQLVNNQPVLGNNPLAPWLDATGLPITDAYWGKVTLAGQPKDVLIQAFERRVLTFTPDNPPAFQVEMGNVGRHYYNWRYNPQYDAPTGTPTPTPTTPAASGCATLPANTGGAYPFLKCGPAGMVLRYIAPMRSSERVKVTLYFPDGTTNSYIQTSQRDGNLVSGYYSLTTQQGMWKITFEGQASGNKSEIYMWLDNPVTTPTIIVFPDPATLDQDITVVAVGFTPGEQVLVGANAPDPNAPFVYAINSASPGGGVTVRIILRSLFVGDKAQFLQPGKYAIVATNQSESHKASKLITVTG